MKILVCQVVDGKTIVQSTSATNISDASELSLIQVGDSIKLLASDEDSHQPGDELVTP